MPAANFKVNDADRAWVDASSTPQPLAPFLDKISLTGARERIGRKTYVRASGYPSLSFEAAYTRARTNPAWQTFEVPCGHDIMINMPERLVEILTT
jgi:hypothetical protein